MNFKEWLRANNRDMISEMSRADDFPTRGGVKTYINYVERQRPGKVRETIRAWIDFQKGKRDDS